MGIELINVLMTTHLGEYDDVGRGNEYRLVLVSVFIGRNSKTSVYSLRNHELVEFVKG